MSLWTANLYSHITCAVCVRLEQNSFFIVTILKYIFIYVTEFYSYSPSHLCSLLKETVRIVKTLATLCCSVPQQSKDSLWQDIVPDRATERCCCDNEAYKLGIRAAEVPTNTLTRISSLPIALSCAWRRVVIENLWLNRLLWSCSPSLSRSMFAPQAIHTDNSRRKFLSGTNIEQKKHTGMKLPYLNKQRT